MIRSGITYFILFFVYVLAQVLILKNLVLFNSAFCFIYVAFILLLPVETSIVMLLLIGFALGFTIDIFYSSMGIHAFATVLTAYVRNYWLKAITPQGGYEVGMAPSLAANSFSWFLIYILPLLFVHLAVLFFVEASGFHLFGYTLLKILGSLIFTGIVLFLLQSLVPQRRKI